MNEEEKRQEVLDANVREVMRTTHGRDVIWEILDLCGIYSLNTTGDREQEGRRMVGISILAMLEEADPEIYPKLLLAKQESNNG